MAQITTYALPDSVRLLLGKRIASAEFELPFLPSTTAEVLALCKQENADARRLALIVERDVTLAAHVLRVANSVAYAPEEPIVSLAHAVSRLGLSVVGEITVSVALRGRVFDVPGYEEEIQHIWRHSAVAAVYARETARLVRHNVEGAYMCGLLHDVGKPLALQALVDVARQRTDRPIPLGIAQSAMAEFHEPLGARLAALWGLSDWIVEAVGHHHEYARAEQFPMEAMIAHLSDLFAHWALDETLDESGFASEDPVIEELGLYADDLERLFRLRPAALDLAEAFG